MLFLSKFLAQIVKKGHDKNPLSDQCPTQKFQFFTVPIIWLQFMPRNNLAHQGWIFYEIINNFSLMICGNFSPKLYATQSKSLQVDKLFPNPWHLGETFPRYLSGNFVKYSPLPSFQISNIKFQIFK